MIVRRRRSVYLEGTLVILSLVCAIYLLIGVSTGHSNNGQRYLGHHSRHILEITKAELDVQTNVTPYAQGNCTPRSIEQFPSDFLTYEQRIHGGVVFHIFVSIYIFAAIAIICDDYFVSSLEHLCEALSLQPDVAGATFMAAGSSAPELFTSIIGVFVAKSDVGTSAIVGSAVFNILFIIAICGLCGGMVIHLTWWPMLRDCLYYTLSVVTLVLVIYDEKVHWYEATVMIVLYFLYIVIMYFNPRLADYFINRYNRWRDRNGKSKEERYADGNDAESDPLLKSQDRSGSFKHSSQRYGIVEEKKGFALQEEDEFVSPLTIPDGWFAVARWVVMLPATVCFMLFVPDCRRPGCWRKCWPLTFTMSVVFIAGISYIMVWMVTIIGDTLGIPDTVMGLTLLAAGTSIPDALSSLFVARDGYGDMAVSNSIGSNVFDILLCLGLPWFIQTVIYDPNSIMYINSSGLTYSSITLLGTVVFLIIALPVNKWRLNKPLGAICIVVYVIVITFSCLYELNVFGPMNPPSCPRNPNM